MLALFILSLAVAAPKVREDIQRDREIETMNRGKQYIRAIQLYYRKFHAYPPNVDALNKTNEIRFLRKQYIDPTTGKKEWKPILFGQFNTPAVVGFFGQPIPGSTVAGIGPSGGSAFGSSSPLQQSQAAGSGSSSPTTGSGSSGQTFGGAGIIGFSPQSPKQSILVYRKKNHYNDWAFTYDPLADRSASGGFAVGAGAAAGGGTPTSASPGGGPGNPGGGPGGYDPGAPPIGPSPWSPNGNLPAPR